MRPGPVRPYLRPTLHGLRHDPAPGTTERAVLDYRAMNPREWLSWRNRVRSGPQMQG